MIVSKARKMGGDGESMQQTFERRRISYNDSALRIAKRSASDIGTYKVSRHDANSH